MASAKDLREVVSAARPLIEEWLDIAEQIAALRDMATDRGLDWSQIKALVKAQVQDERAGDTKRVQRIIEKAEFASAYADMLGLSEKVNENNFSGEGRSAPAPATPPHDPETGEVEEPAAPIPLTGAQAAPIIAGAIAVAFGDAATPLPAGVVDQATDDAALCIVEPPAASAGFSHTINDTETGEVLHQDVVVVAAPVDAIIDTPAPPATAEPFTPPAFLSGERKVLRPNCLRPQLCAGSGSVHCYECTKAAASKEAA